MIVGGNVKENVGDDEDKGKAGHEKVKERTNDDDTNYNIRLPADSI